MEKVDDDLSSPPKSKPKKWSYADGACSNQLKDSGVRRLMIIGIVESINESYQNLKMLTELLNINALKNLDGAIYSNAFDMKVANAFFGISTATSSCPCVWCQMKRALFSDDPTSSGGLLRTLGLIRKWATKYQADTAKHMGKNKLSTADYFSCVNMPLCDYPDSTLILDILPPMELHLILGMVNDIYDVLDAILSKKECSVEAKDWSLPLGLKRPALHQGQFNGNQCRTLLNNRDKLEQLLIKAGAFEVCEPVLKALATFNEVKKSCFGMDIHLNYKGHIKNFEKAYLELSNYCKSLNITFNVTPKAHAIFVHVHQFLERQNARGLNYGLGYWSEQVYYLLS